MVKELADALCSLAPRNKKLEEMITTNFDHVLIHQQLNANQCPTLQLTSFLIKILMRLEAPIRNENTRELGDKIITMIENSTNLEVFPTILQFGFDKVDE